jgi:hypothetical protein
MQRFLRGLIYVRWAQRRRLLKQFSHMSYVKTMSADGGHFGPRSGSLNTILAIDPLRTIDDMFAIFLHPRWLPWADIVLTYIVKPYGIWIVKLRCIWHAEILKRAYLCQVSDTGSPEPLVYSSYVKTMSADGGHFGPRSGSMNTILAIDHLRTIDDMFAILADWFQRRRF